jgi:hypothetical protein
MADISDVDAAISALLLGDATLMAFATDGVYFDLASHGATKFVIVSRMAGFDTRMFSGRAFETVHYLVKAVALSTTGANVKSAAARIDALLEQATLTVTGYGQVIASRIEPMPRYTELDPENDSRWQHRGGLYEVVAVPS